MPDGNPFDYDVFISYSSRDKAWVRGELLKRIEQAGLKAFIDFRDFTRGAPSIKEMERGVLKSRKTLVILTPDYVESEWCELEEIMVQTLTPANRKLRIIPLLKKECEKPLYVGALTHIDFTDGADLDLAWRQLLIALGRPPEPEPPKKPQRDDWFLAHPYPMPPNFTGRVAERDMLTRWLDVDAAHPLLSLRALGASAKARSPGTGSRTMLSPPPGRASSGGASTKATPASTTFWPRRCITSAAGRSSRIGSRSMKSGRSCNCSIHPAQQAGEYATCFAKTFADCI